MCNKDSMTWGSFDLFGHSLYMNMLNPVLPEISGFHLRLSAVKDIVIQYRESWARNWSQVA